MKRLLAIILILVCVTSCAAASGIDFSRLTIKQLQELIEEINKEIVSRPEWKETTVPVGTWIVGKDIPAGEYSISFSGKTAYLRIETKPGSLMSNTLISQGISSEKSNVGKVALLDGYSVEVSINPVIFAPAISLGF